MINIGLPGREMAEILPTLADTHRGEGRSAMVHFAGDEP